MSQHPFQNFMIRFRGGETIFQEGDPGSTMFVVHSGRVQLFRHAGVERRPVGEMEKGDFFGEMSILEGLPRPYAAAAEEDCELIEINSATFDKMIRSNIEIAVRMLRKLSIRLRETESALSALECGGMPAAGRVSAPRESGSKAAKAAAHSGARLEGLGRVFALDGRETVIGRFDPVTGIRPDIDLTELDLKRSVSRQHARIVHTNGGYEVVEQVGALNGTFLNDEKLVAGEPRRIAEGDCIKIGTVALTFLV
jgi:CRP-like cAMP-binding protein